MPYHENDFAVPARSPGARRGWRVRLAPLLLLALAACGGVQQQLEDAFVPRTPHERYAASLRGAGLDATALGRDWLAAAERALAAPVAAPLPFREAGFFAAEEAGAVAYRIRGARGQRITAEVVVEGTDAPRLFVDLFEIPEDTARPPQHRESADSGGAVLVWEPRRDADFLLRLQPELLRAARYTVTVRSEGALAFPVEGRDSRAIGSPFGVDRDGGRRQHHGIDVFAPRGTPVLAAAEGTVTRVEETPRGGRVVWVRDEARGQSHYYAHLDEQRVAAGTRVRPGDTLGTVGNTGNARTTPPHLHFGIYRRGEGPIDPQPWVHTPRAAPPAVAVEVERLGRWARTGAASAPLREEPGERASTLASLPRHTPFRLLGASGSWYRVALPDGRAGYVAARATEPVERPVRTERLAAAAPLHDRPASAATTIDTLRAGASVPVLARFGGFLMVEGPDGRAGWIPAE